MNQEGGLCRKDIDLKKHAEETGQACGVGGCVKHFPRHTPLSEERRSQFTFTAQEKEANDLASKGT